jgi:hypothetical protein
MKFLKLNVLKNNIKQKLQTVIFPQGKVHLSYTKYVKWYLFTNLISSVEFVLSTHSMLSVVGSPVAGNSNMLSINYISKDIIGQLGGLWYMNKMSKTVDKNPRNFSNKSLQLEQYAIAIECVTPLLPVYAFVPVAGLCNISKNISYTGFGAINTKIIQMMATDNNLGEIYSKITILNTLTTSFGMIIGLFITYKIPDHTQRLLLIPFLAWLRIYSYEKTIEDFI